MNLQPSEFIAKNPGTRQQPHTTWSLALSYASGTTSSYLSMHSKDPTSGYTLP